MGKRVKILRETMKAAEDGCYFEEVTMAVFDNSEDQYRYSCFEKYFAKPEKE